MMPVTQSVYLPSSGTNIKVLDPQAVEQELTAIYNNIFNVQRDVQLMKESFLDFQEFIQKNYPDVAKEYFLVRAAQGRIK